MVPPWPPMGVQADIRHRKEKHEKFLHTPRTKPLLTPWQKVPALRPWGIFPGTTMVVEELVGFLSHVGSPKPCLFQYQKGLPLDDLGAHDLGNLQLNGTN